MKIIDIQSGISYDIPITKDRENQQPCPKCSGDRKKKNAKSFSYNAEKGLGYCQHCQSSFAEKKEVKEKTYFVPEWKNITDLSADAVRYFEARAISQPTLVAMRVYSDTVWFPQTGKDEPAICFPYFRNEKLINVKSRAKGKLFTFVKDAELIFYNADSISDGVTIVEGEIDVLSFIEAGVKNVISVPNGASNFGFLDSEISALDELSYVNIAVDQDMPGMKLKDELVRRIGAERCRIVNFKDCKDANEYLIKYGGYELAETIKEAKPVPIEGIIDLNKAYADCLTLFKDGIQPGEKIGMSELDSVITWETSRLAIVTGIPSHGKSTFVDFAAACLCVQHGWRVGVFSPENYPVKYHIRNIVSVYSGKPCSPKYMTEEEFERTYDFIESNYQFMYPEENFTIETILEKARAMVRMSGIKQLIIDPWNVVDHQYQRGENETQYISRVLSALHRFAKLYDVLVWLVAHPTKQQMDYEKGKFPKPTLYSISGSAHFYNKADYGIVVYRDFELDEILIDVQKVKFKHLGKPAPVRLKFNEMCNRYDAPDVEKFTTCYLDSKPFSGVKKAYENYYEPHQPDEFQTADNWPF